MRVAALRCLVAEVCSRIGIARALPKCMKPVSSAVEFLVVAEVGSAWLTYPVLTFRWLAVHALAVPTVFFLGSILAMQFI